VSLPFAGYAERGSIIWYDFAGAVVLTALAATALVLVLHARVRRAAFLLTGAVTVAVPLVMTLWSASLEPLTPKEIADAAQRDLGRRSYCFYRSYALGVGFGLRTVVPIARTEDELRPLVARDPRLVLIMRDSPEAPAKSMPTGFHRRLSFHSGDGVVHFCEFTGADPAILRGAGGEVGGSEE
jgi:hypothetical protein